MDTVRLLTEESEFEELETDWRRIYDESADSDPFLSYDWMFTWWRHFRGDGRLSIVVVERDGAVAGIAPMMRLKSAGLTRLQFLGRPISDYPDFLISGDRHRCIESLAEYITRDVRWDSLELRGIRGDSPNYAALKDTLLPSTGLSRWHPWAVAPSLALHSDWSDYFDGLKKGFRTDTRRQFRRLEEKGDLVFRECGTLEEALQLLDILAQQKSQRFVSNGATAAVRVREVLAFYKEVTSLLWERGEVHVSSLDLEDRPIAIHFGFVCGERYFYYAPSFDSALFTYSPGRLLLFNLIRNSFDRGLREFDFMNGAETYKYDWTSDERMVYELVSFRRTPGGLALYGAYEAQRRARASSLLRKWVRWARKKTKPSTS